MKFKFLLQVCVSGVIACPWSCSLFAADPAPAASGPATPAAIAKPVGSPTSAQSFARPSITIRGRVSSTVPTDRTRVGITHHGSTAEFPKYPMTRQMDGSLPHTRKFGDGTVIAGPERLGITHAGKTFPYGAEIGTRRTGWANTGLTTEHTPGRVWSSFRKAPSITGYRAIRSTH